MLYIFSAGHKVINSIIGNNTSSTGPLSRCHLAILCSRTFHWAHNQSDYGARSAFSQAWPVYPSSQSLRMNVCGLQNVPGWSYFSCTFVPLYCFLCVCVFCVLVLLDSYAVAWLNKSHKILGWRVARAEWRAGRMKTANDCIQNGRCYTFANEWFITEMLRFDIDLCGDKVKICCLFLRPLLHDSREIGHFFSHDDSQSAMHFQNTYANRNNENNNNKIRRNI